MRLRATIVGVMLLASALSAQVKTLTEVQRLQVLNAAKDVEIWQLKVQQATVELDRSRDVLTKLIASVTPAGYRMNDNLELIAIPESEHGQKD